MSNETPNPTGPRCPVDHALTPIPSAHTTSPRNIGAPLKQLLDFLGHEGDYIESARAEAGGGGVFRAEAGVPFVVINDPAAVRQALESPIELVDRSTHNGFGPTAIRREVVGSSRPILTTRGAPDRPERQLLNEWTRRRAQTIRDQTPKAVERAARAWMSQHSVELPMAMGDILGDILGTGLLGATIKGQELFAFNEVYLQPRTINSVSNWMAAKFKPAGKKGKALGESMRSRFVEGPLFAEAEALGAEHGLDAERTSTLISMMAVINGGLGSSIFCSSALVELSLNRPWVDRLIAEVGDGAIDPDKLDDSDVLQRIFLELHRLYHRPRAFFRVVQKPFVLTDSEGVCYPLETGDHLMIHAATAHRDPGLFDDPTRFDPDRYLKRPELRDYVWDFGTKTQDNYTCIGQRAGIADNVFLVLLTTLLRDYEWRYSAPPTLNINNRFDVGPAPFSIVAFRPVNSEPRDPRYALTTSAPSSATRSNTDDKSKFGAADRLKLRALMGVRWVNRASIERWSKYTFRTPYRDQDLPPLVTAAEQYDSPILPPVLKVPSSIPTFAKLKAFYVYPYYILAGALFKGLEAAPLHEDVEWSPSADWNDWFPPHPEGWADLQNDRDYTAMRLQGPNPFLLKKAKKRGHFELDFAPIFDGVYAPVKATFKVVKDELMAVDISIGSEVFKPGDDGWNRAKFVVNGLDARYTVFLGHLMHTHLISSQGFAIAAFSLASDHPFRPFVDFFTYGSLTVNDYAFKLLVTPASYFLQCNFRSGGDVGKLFDNYTSHYSLDKLMPHKDIASRGIDKIPNHPYVEDALEIWKVIEEVVRDYVQITHATDDLVRDDKRLQVWYARLLEILPDRTADSHPLETVEALVELLAAMIYLNVYHEVCGDFSPYVSARTMDGKRLINFDNLENSDEAIPRAKDVFLFDQGAWAGRFNNGGNYLMSMDLEAHVTATTLRASLLELQRRLREVDLKLGLRNRTRRIPFLRMQPSQWKASISY